MGNKIAVTKDGVHKIGKKLFLTDENHVHRKAKKAFLTKDGVHRLVFSSGVKWVKWECYDYVRIWLLYTENSENVGDTTTESLGVESVVYGDYSFWQYGGYEGKGSMYKVGDSEGNITDWIVGYYIVYPTAVYKITSLDNEDGDVTCEIVASCEEEEHESTEYYQGSSAYGVFEAEEDELPEEGSLVDGSPTGEYCVLYCEDGHYYYYIRGEE
jgi:hypothetical protein